MTDRASDNDPAFEELGIEQSKLLKCCAHIILGVDNAADKVFHDVETKVGVHKLLDIGAGTLAFKSSTSIHTLDQIAIAKLLSPSHAAHSISLYGNYIDFLEKRDMRGTFKGFVSNRFGRIAEIAKYFIDNKCAILKFFRERVDEHSNQLVLAVSVYIVSE